MALGLPTQGCEFGPCEAGPSNAFPGAGAIAGTIACQFAEPCGAIEDIALAAGTVGVLGYDIYLMGRKQSNEWTDAARKFAPGDPCGWLDVQKAKPENADSATQKKIVQAQKFLGAVTRINGINRPASVKIWGPESDDQPEVVLHVITCSLSRGCRTDFAKVVSLPPDRNQPR